MEVKQEHDESENISIKPSINEIERFISFLNTRFTLGIKNDLIVLIQTTNPRVKGYYSPLSWKRETLAFKQENETQEKESINEITLNSYYLKDTPYETIAHELAHYLNTLYKEKEGKGNYHTADFKKRAEQLKLKVSKGKHGWNETEITAEFEAILQEFEPNEEAFNIFKLGRTKPQKQKTRLLKYTCSCGCIIRTAKNEMKPLKAVCGYCNTNFELNDEGNDDD